MKSMFIFVLALLLASQQCYAQDNPSEHTQSKIKIDAYNHHKQPFSGSHNKIFTPLGKLEQQSLSKASPMADAGYNVSLIERVSWVKVNTGAIDALRSYAIEVMGQAEGNPDLVSFTYKDYQGSNYAVRVKHPLDFAVDINLNFFNDIEFNDLFLGEITKTTTLDDAIYYSITLNQRSTSLPAIHVKLEDKLTIYASSSQTDFRLEQTGNSKFRIFQQKRPRLIEEQVNSTVKKTEPRAKPFSEPFSSSEKFVSITNSALRILP